MSDERQSQLQSIWLQDVPPASDMTFLLATLHRVERRRFRREVWQLLAACAVMSGLVYWQYPALDALFAQWLMSHSVSLMSDLSVGVVAMCVGMLVTLLLVVERWLWR